MLRTRSEAETERVGEQLARALRPGSVVGLCGPLGAGQTALVRGIARALGVDERAVHSPTFLTAAEYTGRHRLIHVDLYRHGERLPDPEWLAELLEGDAVAVVEWFEHLGDAAPRGAVVVRIDYAGNAEERVLEVSADLGVSLLEGSGATAEAP
jgi:tRNA threonylcarbamoyl adenosine modification protein YjeE